MPPHISVGPGTDAACMGLSVLNSEDTYCSKDAGSTHARPSCSASTVVLPRIVCLETRRQVCSRACHRRLMRPAASRAGSHMLT